jgi:hypothetical protein
VPPAPRPGGTPTPAWAARDGGPAPGRGGGGAGGPDRDPSSSCRPRSHDKGPEAEEGVELQEGECLRVHWGCGPRPGRASGARTPRDRRPSPVPSSDRRRGRPWGGGADGGGHRQRPAGGVR